MTSLSLDRTSRPAESARDSSFLLAFGFGTSVAMWGLGFLLRMPPVWMPSAGLLFVLLVCQVVGGAWAARSTGLGVRAGAAVGGLSAVINLLVLGSVLGEGETGMLARAALWIPGSILLGALLGAAGAALTRGAGRGSTLDVLGSTWTERFAQVAVCATLFLILVGGVVTSKEAGLAVVDWPNSFGTNMFLFPLSRMTGGVYYEHAHRLFGSLVGLTTLVLAVLLQWKESRPWLKGLGWVALLMVIVQGILGGLRVTGTFTSSTDPEVVAPNLTLALVHGVFGQVFFGTLVAIAVFTSRVWRDAAVPLRSDRVRTDRRLTAILVGVVVVQLVLGAILRHTAGGLHLHLTMAVAVIVLAQVVGSRGMTHYREALEYARLSKILVGLIGMQFLLGIGALVAVALARDSVTPPTYEVVLATAHQATGAVLLAASVVLALWSRRLLRPST